LATHSSDITTPANDRVDFAGGPKLVRIGAVVAVAGLAAALGLGFSGKSPLRPFLFGYLAAYVFVLAIALGALSFVLLQHVTRAAWSVCVRRTAENVAAALPLLALFGLPLLIAAASGNGTPWRWALPMDEKHIEPGAEASAAKGEAEVDPLELRKKEDRKKALEERGTTLTDAKWKAPEDPKDFKLDSLDLGKRNYGLHWLNPWFFILRIVFYLAVFSGMAIWYRRTSIAQDRTSDDTLTLKMQAAAGPCLVILGLTVTGLAFDLLMSLDPHWYSTMFGVYYIANCFLASYAVLIIAHYLLQRAGYLGRSVTLEHYHDMGKYLFAFTFFYGYIAFSQYMLMWYANIPEETEWMARHGVSTAYIVPLLDGTFARNGWCRVLLVILFCHILIPFAGVMSRHVKRRPGLLAFWALWQLTFVAVDMFWLTMPEMGSTTPNYYGPEIMQVVITACAIAGLGGALLAAYGWLSGKAALRPTHDPRLADSLVFQNI
jgi:hypothetical protein